MPSTTRGARPDVFSDLKARWGWRPIPHCPGRFVFADGPTHIPPGDLATPTLQITEHIVAAATDPVIVAVFSDGGLISYRKPDGRYLHTLNARDGLERKLQQLGIELR